MTDLAAATILAALILVEDEEFEPPRQSKARRQTRAARADGRLPGDPCVA